MNPEKFELHHLGEDEESETARIQRLSLEDTVTQRLRGLRTATTKGKGYNPYDTFPNTSSTGAFAQHRDLRELSKWIRAKRQVEKLRDEEKAEATGIQSIPPQDKK